MKDLLALVSDSMFIALQVKHKLAPSIRPIDVTPRSARRVQHTRTWFMTLLVSICCLGAMDSIAQSTQQDSTKKESEKKTHFLIEPYFLAPTMKGEIGIRNLPNITVDANPGDIFDQLKFAAMAYVEVDYDHKFAITTDFIFMRLESDVKPNTLVSSGTNTTKQLVFEIAGLIRLAPWFEVGAGSRVLDMKAELDLNTTNGHREESSRKTWMNPILVVRSQGVIRDRWLLQFRGDIGGFGLGSDFAWQIQANAGYQFSKLFRATIGYRVLDEDYKKGDGEERFLYDIATSGPVLRIGFTFQ